MGIIKEANSDVASLSSHTRFATMDGLRGVAALAVVLFHSFLNGGLIKNGPLAVDFFFILSGFVIAYSYEARLAAGRLSTGRFLLVRFIRLYPMAFLAAAGGLVIAFVHNRTNPGSAYPVDATLTSGLLSLLVIPYLSPAALGDKAFSFNPPLWSLFFEAAANVVYAALRPWLTVPVLAALTAISLIWVGWHGSLGGGSKADFIGGVPRVIAGFFGGVLLFKLWRAGLPVRSGGNVIVLGAIMLAIFCLPWSIAGWLYLPVFALMWLIVAAAADARPSRFDRVSEFLGDISYPLYLSHWLTLYVWTFIGNKLGFTGPRYVYVVIAHAIASPFMAFAIGHFFEKPARLRLRKTLFGGSVAS